MPRLNDNQRVRIDRRRENLQLAVDARRAAAEAAAEPRRAHNAAKRQLDRAREQGRPAKVIAEFREAFVAAREAYRPLLVELNQSTRKLERARDALSDQRAAEFERAEQAELRRAKNRAERIAARRTNLADQQELAGHQARMEPMLIKAGFLSRSEEPEETLDES